MPSIRSRHAPAHGPASNSAPATLPALRPESARRAGRPAAILEAGAAWLCLLWMAAVTGSIDAARAQAPAAEAPGAAAMEKLGAEYEKNIQPLLRRYCFECHSKGLSEAEIDFESMPAFAAVRRHAPVWQRAAEMLESGQMPPPDAGRRLDDDRPRLLGWVRGYLAAEAAALAGDPGPVVLRRLSNAEYTYTLRDLTGADSLNPAREFPADGAAGEGFTNTGNALSMSPALVAKYLDAAKDTASHAVLLPSGFRFSPLATRGDWTNEALDRIRGFYKRFTDDGGGDTVNLQGIVFNTNQGGRLPVEKYLAATLAEREAISSGRFTIAEAARRWDLNEKYMGIVWKALTSEKRSLLLDGVRAAWKSAQAVDSGSLAKGIIPWQQALWKFSSVGHIGKLNGPKAWMEPVSPMASSQELRIQLKAPADGKPISLYLSVGDAGDGSEGDDAVWEKPRLVAPGRPDILLRDVRGMAGELAARREHLLADAAGCLAAAAEASAGEASPDAAVLARKHGVDAASLAAWMDYLGIGSGGPARLGDPITRKLEKVSGYDFIRGWGGDDALSVVANSSDQHVRIPGNMKPHGISAHPAPSRSVAAGWRSAAPAVLRIQGAVQHAHPECGNGVAWFLELRRGGSRQRLAAGTSHGPTVVAFGPIEKVAVLAGDAITLSLHPRDGNHSCDLTAIDLTLNDGSREWDLARDLSPDILAGNPHADSRGDPGAWLLFSEPVSDSSGHIIPSGSLLARWQAAAGAEEKQKLAAELQRLLQDGAGSLPKGSPDAELARQLTSLGGPLLAPSLREIAAKPAAVPPSPALPPSDAGAPFGLDPSLFGRHPDAALPGSPPAAKPDGPEAGADRSVDAESLCVRAPSVIEVRLPAELAAGSELVAGCRLHAGTGGGGSVQMQILAARPENPAGLQATAVSETDAGGLWTSNNRGISYATPIIAADGSAARRRIEEAFEEFRQVFPPVLCYTKIVPVDEVVTLTLFHREDGHLRRLMLDDRQAAQLDALWDELHAISRDALSLVDALAQILEYATQDADPKVFEPLRKPVQDRAAAFQEQLIAWEPVQLEALVDFAAQAYRRPLAAAEREEIRALYGKLRREDIPHEEAFRLSLARIFVSPAFLYRIEKPGPGAGQSPVSGWELATRLSYFLWSSQPDAELRQLAEAGRLEDPATLAAQARRMLGDVKVRRLAVEFGCQWLHVRDFDQLEEKSERHFPEFAALRGAIHEETIQFFTHFFTDDGAVIGLLDADFTYLNAELAKFYGIPGVAGPEWHRVDGVRKHSRGGILGLASTLAMQSGASRTSPILRGNWICESVLGEKLPRPPKNVPQLAATVPEGLTERQMIERHKNDPACVKCHARIDPYGFALEHFDAIGRYRDRDAAGLEIDSRATLPDGSDIDGLAGLRGYLLSERRETFIRHFYRKLLGFALGRSVRLSDEPLLSDMAAAARTGEGRIGAAIEAIVRSRQFRDIRSRERAQDE